MYWLLAQQQVSGPSRFQQLFDQLARTPLSKVLIFVGVCTLIRLVIHPYLTKTQPHHRTGGYSTARFFNEILDAIIYAGVVVFMLIRPFAVQTFLIPSESMVHTLEINDFIIANKAVYRYTDPKRGDIIVFRPPSEALDKSSGEVDFIKRLIGTPGDVVEVKEGVLWRNGKALKEPYVNYDPPTIPRILGEWKLVHYNGPYEPWKGKYIPVYYDYRGFANYQIGTSSGYAIGLNHDVPDVMDKAQAQDWKREELLTAEEQERMKYLYEAPAAKIPEGYYLMIGDNRNRSFDGRAWGLVPRQNLVGRSEVIWWPPSRWQKTRPVRVGEDAPNQ